MAQLHIEVEEDLKNDLDEIARRNDRKLAQEVRRALRMWVIKEKLMQKERPTA